MKKWSDEEGTEFHNSDVCYGREYKPPTDKVDVAKISIRGRFPEQGWGYLEATHEMAVVVRGEGYAQAKDGERYELVAGDVIYIEADRQWCWGGNMDMIVSCGPAFNPSKHKIEQAA